MPSNRPPKSAKNGALLFGVLSALTFPGMAMAEESDDAAGSSTIIVTGHREPDANPNANANAPYKVEKSADGKYTEPLRDTPKTITAIPKEVIEDLGATSFRDVVRTQPGVTLGTGEGGNAFGDRIFIRGFEARNDVYIDGMRDPGVTSREIFAIEQIEIVKGASSAFGGRGNTGGSVSLQSKKPVFSNFLVGEGVIGTENFYRGTLDFNRKLSDTIAIRINGLYHNADTPGRDYVNTERYGGAASVLWAPTDRLEVKADYYYFRYDGIPDYGHPFDSTTQRPFKVNADNYYGVIGRDFIKNGAEVATLDVSYHPMDSLKLHTQTRYGTTYNHYVVSVPRAPCQRAVTATLTCPTTGAILPIAQWTVSVGSPQRKANNRYYANISDATLNFATGGVDHTMVIGFELADERVSAGRYAFPATVEDSSGNIISAPGTFVRNLLTPNPVLGYSIPAIVDTTPATVTSVKTMSVFLLDTLKFSPKLEALFGIRYDDYAIDLDRNAGLASSGAAVTALHLQNNVNFFNYQASLVYKPVEAGTLYVSYSTSSNPSGEQLDGNGVTYNGLAATTQNLEPERNTSYELGGKLEVAGGNLLLTAALFQTTKDNAREQVTPGVFDLVGELRSRGFEASVNGNLTPRLSLFGGYTYIDATIRKSVTPANVGARFPNIPKHAVSLLATYKLTDDFTLGGQAYHQSNLHGGLVAAGTSTVPGYWRFDAVARFRISSQAEARLNVLNIADKRYYEAIYTSASPFTFVAPGRSANLTFALKL
jgi:catecholate siderophore receptor